MSRVRLSEEQRKLLAEAAKVGALSLDLPDYWTPRSARNGRIARLEARGFLQKGRTSTVYSLTDAGRAAIEGTRHDA